MRVIIARYGCLFCSILNIIEFEVFGWIFLTSSVILDPEPITPSLYIAHNSLKFIVRFFVVTLLRMTEIVNRECHSERSEES